LRSSTSATSNPGQFVLVTAASGGAGLGAIHTARLLGATTIATTRTGAKKRALLDAGASHVIVTGEEDLLTRIKEITKGKGADLIFDPVAGDTLPALAEAVSWGGQIILYGALGSVEKHLYGLQLLRTFQSWIAAQPGGTRTRNQIYPAESGGRQTEAHHRKNVPLE
jgi:NADPH:quinone reductase-like Zn-dependent oxidoreductase